MNRPSGVPIYKELIESLSELWIPINDGLCVSAWYLLEVWFQPLLTKSTYIFFVFDFKSSTRVGFTKALSLIQIFYTTQQWTSMEINYTLLLSIPFFFFEYLHTLPPHLTFLWNLEGISFPIPSTQDTSFPFPDINNSPTVRSVLLSNLHLTLPKSECNNMSCRRIIDLI